MLNYLKGAMGMNIYNMVYGLWCFFYPPYLDHRYNDTIIT